MTERSVYTYLLYSRSSLGQLFVHDVKQIQSASPMLHARNIGYNTVWSELCECIRSKYSTPQLTARRLQVLRVYAKFEGLTEFCFVFRFGFRASLLDFMSRIERLHVCYHCADV